MTRLTGPVVKMHTGEATSLVPSRLASMLLLTIGAITFNLSLYSLTTNNPFPFSILLAGIFFQALAVTLFIGQLFSNSDSGKSRNFFLIFMIVLSFSLAFTRLSRFAGFNGFDFVRESGVVQNSFRSGYWDPNLSFISNYQSSMAVSVLPVITSSFLHVPAGQVLLLQTFLLTALLPLAVMGVVSSLTGDFRLGTLTASLLAQNWFFFGAHIIGKTSLAILFCVLSFYCLLRTEGSLRMLGTILGLGVAMAHYTVSLVLVLILLFLLVWSIGLVPLLRHASVFRNAKPVPVSVPHITATIGFVVLWLLFAAPAILPAVTNSVTQVSSSLSSLAAGPKKVDTSNDAGPIVAAWFYFQNALIGLGSLIWLNAYRKGTLQGRVGGWILVGISLIILLLGWIFLPYLSVGVESTRILSIILPFTIVFMGVIFLRAFLSRGRLLKVAALGVIFLMLPMNMMLPNQDRNILYHQLGSLPIDKRISEESITVTTDSNQVLALWVVGHVPLNNPVEVDAVGRYAMITSVPFPRQVLFLQDPAPPYGSRRYLILSSYLMVENTWSIGALGNRSFISADPSFFFLPVHNIIYSSPKFWIVGPNP